MLSKEHKVVCICRRGQVRSVAVRNILADRYGFLKAIACGWENNDEATLRMLFDWADFILVVGRGSDWNLNIPPKKTHLLNVGRDRWSRYDHPELLAILAPLVENLLGKEVSQLSMPCSTV